MASTWASGWGWEDGGSGGHEGGLVLLQGQATGPWGLSRKPEGHH